MRWRGCWCGASPAGLRGCVPNLSTQSTPQDVSLVRRFMNAGATAFAIGAATLVIVPLLAIFVYLVIKGVGSINISFLTQTPKPPGEAGRGTGPALAGTRLMD